MSGRCRRRTRRAPTTPGPSGRGPRDGGKTWTWLRNGLRHDNHTAYYGYGNDSHDAQGTGLGFLVSRDEGATWTTLTSPQAGLNTFGWDVSSDRQTILVNPSDALKLERSTKGGSTFADVSILEIAPAGPMVISRDGNTLLYAGNNLIVRAPVATSSGAEKVFEAPAFARGRHPRPLTSPTASDATGRQ